MLYIFHHDNLSNSPVRKKITLRATLTMTEGFNKRVSESPFHCAWVCTPSCIDICFRLTHPRTKNAEGCSSSLHSLHTIQKKLYGAQKRVWKCWGKKNGQKSSYSQAEEKGRIGKKCLEKLEWEVGICLVCRLMIHKTIFHLHQTGKLRTWSFEHSWARIVLYEHDVLSGWRFGHFTMLGNVLSHAHPNQCQWLHSSWYHGSLGKSKYRRN